MTRTGLGAVIETVRSTLPLRAGRVFRGSEAAELLEFALALPLILVMLVGLLDFASAYHLKQELANAAREGARLGSSESILDTTTASPDSVQAIKDDVTAYLLNAGVNTNFIGSSMAQCTNSSGSTIAFCWEYISNGNYGLMIQRNYQIYDSDGNPIYENRVTLTYPYDWTYGFNHIIKLLVPSSNLGGSITITTVAAMPQLGA